MIHVFSYRDKNYIYDVGSGSLHECDKPTADYLKAKEEGVQKNILFCLSGHGLIDMTAYDQYNAGDLTNYDLPQEVIDQNVAKLEKLV